MQDDCPPVSRFSIRKDDPVLNRPQTIEGLKTLPTLEDLDDLIFGCKLTGAFYLCLITDGHEDASLCGRF